MLKFMEWVGVVIVVGGTIVFIIGAIWSDILDNFSYSNVKLKFALKFGLAGLIMIFAGAGLLFFIICYIGGKC